MKKVMLLGGNYFQMTATKAAKALGYHVISVDYLPNNPGHCFADEYYNVSTTDQEAVLALAKKLKIDGIVSYASDVSAPTAAYVAAQMGLPGNPPEAVNILTNKDRMRLFLETHQFNCPKGAGFDEYAEAFAYFKTLRRPTMVKPVDSSGSKGVSKLVSENEFEQAWSTAKNYSRSGRIIIEEFVERSGYQIAGDAFLEDGKILFAGLMNEHFDHLCNPLVPIGESYPAILTKDMQEKAMSEIQRLLSLLGMRLGAVNLDFIFDKSGNVYILEIGPRNGGNLITDVIRESGDIDLAKCTIQAAVGEKTNDFAGKREHSLVSSYIVHSLEDKVYRGLRISDTIRRDIISLDIWASEGAHVKRFDNGSFGLGAALIRHENTDEMCYRMDHMEEFISLL